LEKVNLFFQKPSGNWQKADGFSRELTCFRKKLPAFDEKPQVFTKS
jgi:hypothetical protein